jgi:formylglycine-generating enzyme required for sulfatase activity/serine/threonine protein kinase
MSEPQPPSESLPDALEEEVLAILDGDEQRREERLREVLAAHPRHVVTIRRWLTAAGVELPGGDDGAGAPAGTGATADGDGDALPQALGPYVLVEKLGRGGFGTVYRGEQQHPIRRPVAVKILNPGMDSRDVLARFAAEREALNRMDHPGIARLLDAGTTAKGRPFFVMELVVGPTLLAWCRKHHLSLRARVQLFLLVLDAAQHAHQKAMLHRDLSSNNVLVADRDGEPQPKIIDFGIAKSLRDPLLQGGATTMRGTLLGTPEFMSPEQAAGSVDDLDTRADVYALGVQAYELLSDQLPIPGVALRARGIAGIADVVRTYQPARPSEVAPRGRARELRGDLDAIVMKAIAKAREERYGSVGEFAADLRRWLADEPVAVATPSTWHRVRKFVRRNRAPSVAVAIAAAGLLGGFAMLWSALAMARSAAEEAQKARKQSEEKADAGFLLLANEERLAAAIAAEQALPPPWPGSEQAYERWLRDHGEPLELEQQKLRGRLDQFAGETPVAGGAVDDLTSRHLANALARLDREFAAFRADGGPLRSVQRRARLLQQVVAPAARAHAASWDAVAAAIERSDGSTASKDYRGLRVPVLPGLVPLGADPATNLHEFLDLASHEPGYPLPPRDAATGVLRTDAGTGIVLVLLPAGRFDQGARTNRPGDDRNDEHADAGELDGGPVSLDAFLIARTELTQAQWSRLVGSMPLADDPQLPVTGVDWNAAVATLRRHGMALPTEAQWEYACRANTRGPWSTGTAIADVATAGWFTRGLQPVGLLQPNGFGLFDLHGNAAEWCADEKLSYRDSEPRRGDGLRERPAPRTGEELRVARGGAWHQPPERARTTARDARPPSTRDATIGLRAARPLRPRD